MKTTTQQCFSNGTDFMVWQDRNCFRCKKAVFYNERLMKMPQYRCAVQKQTEEQSIGVLEEVNVRTYEAAQCRDCPFFKAKFEETEKESSIPEYGAFAKGESLVKPQEPQKEEPKKPTQEFVNVGGLVVPKEEAKAAEKRMFDTMYENFKQGKMPPVLDKESKFKASVKDGVQEMLKTFTWDENMMIAFVPLIISDIAWHFADKVIAFCVQEKIEIVRKLTKAVRIVKNDYYASIKEDLDSKHIDNISAQSKRFIDLYAKDFQIFWWSVNGEIKKEYPDVEYTDMATDACCCIFMIDFLRKHNDKMDKIIESKMGASNSIMHPDMVRLRTLMEAYLPEGFDIQGKDKIKLALKIVDVDMHRIQFQVVNDNRVK